MIELIIESCGPVTSVQDYGRFGYRRFGVSTAGCMDRASLALSNLLVGNSPFGPVIEFCLTGGCFQAHGGSLSLALVGTTGRLEGDGKIIQANQSFCLEAGETVRIDPVKEGVYAYLAVGGGLDLTAELGSFALNRRTGIGGRPLEAGDRLRCTAPAASGAPELWGDIQAVSKGPIRVLFGPQDDLFLPETVDTFLTAPFKIMPNSDRMACNLEGPRLKHKSGYNIVSDGVLPGSIQVPGSECPIILMRDCQTTGGYPKIATVISADLDRLAQSRPGTIVHFQTVTHEQAIIAAKEAARRIERLSDLIRPLVREPDSETLLGLNLIGGVVDCRNWDS